MKWCRRTSEAQPGATGGVRSEQEAVVRELFRGCSRRGGDPARATRRQVLVQFGAAGFGLTLPELVAADQRLPGDPGSTPSAPGAAVRSRRATSCILLFLSGGASQYETFDPKPEAPSEYRGTFRPIPTNVPGIQLSEHLPRLARQANRFALVRSLTHTEANHPAGVYWMVTGRKYPRATARAAALAREDHPHYGSVLAQLRPAGRALPSFVTLPEQMNPNGPIRSGQHAGFLGPAFDPLVLNADFRAAEFRPGELRLLEGLTEGRLLRRRALLQATARRAEVEALAAGGGIDAHYAQAFDLLAGGDAARAFDLDREPAATRERYGRHLFGQGCLMARRLVEAGVRLVAVNWVRHDDGPGGQGWDSHSKHLEWCRDELLPPTDRAIAALLADLHERGLLDETLVVVTGEFGRTPKFNPEGGRDHWPHVFSGLLAGGGIRGGQAYGASTPDGAYPAADPVTPGDFAATLYHCLGLDPRAEISDALGRPFPIAEGEVVRGLL
jgi:hypothetical protein